MNTRKQRRTRKKTRRGGSNIPVRRSRLRRIINSGITLRNTVSKAARCATGRCRERRNPVIPISQQNFNAANSTAEEKITPAFHNFFSMYSDYRTFRSNTNGELSREQIANYYTYFTKKNPTPIQHILLEQINSGKNINDASLKKLFNIHNIEELKDITNFLYQITYAIESYLMMRHSNRDINQVVNFMIDFYKPPSSSPRLSPPRSSPRLSPPRSLSPHSSRSAYHLPPPLPNVQFNLLNNVTSYPSTQVKNNLVNYMMPPPPTKNKLKAFANNMKKQRNNPKIHLSELVSETNITSIIPKKKSKQRKTPTYNLPPPP
jgi:hypothetical protein